MTDTASFTGIPAAALDFYRRLQQDNTKTFWEAHRSEYDDAVRDPIRLLCAELDEFGPFHLFRPHNDMRFAKNRPPYKTQQAAYGESEGGAGFYLEVSSAGLRAGTGYYAMARDQLERFRAAVDDDATGVEVAALTATVSQPGGVTVGAISELKTAPRGFPRDHPRIELLRRKGLMVMRDFGDPSWLHSRRVVSMVRSFWASGADLNGWLDANVGPSTLEPEIFRR
ncbi:MAG: DUF2461 domain-containing protein [Acidimicrobiales bacterium]